MQHILLHQVVCCVMIRFTVSCTLHKEHGVLQTVHPMHVCVWGGDLCVCVCVCVCVSVFVQHRVSQDGLSLLIMYRHLFTTPPGAFGLAAQQGAITATEGYGDLLDWVLFDGHDWLWHPIATRSRIDVRDTDLSLHALHLFPSSLHRP